MHVDDWYSTARNQEQCPLLRLPAELRNKIYEYALSGFQIHIDRDPITCQIRARHALLKETNDRHAQFQALTTTCRQIHQESQPLPVTLNEFVGRPEDLFICLRYGLAYVGTIRRLRIFVDGSSCLVWPADEFRLRSDLVQQLRDIRDYCVQLEYVVLERSVSGFDPDAEARGAAQVLAAYRAVFVDDGRAPSIGVEVETG
jgi:hypothetical protein